MAGAPSDEWLPSGVDIALQDASQLRGFIDALPMHVWLARPDGSTEFQNKSRSDYLGSDATEARGLGWKDAVHPDDVEQYLAKWAAIKASGAPGEAEARFRRCDGEYRWFLIRLAPIFDAHGEVARWCGASTDIEDRKRTEETLRSSERRTMLEAIPALTALMKPNGELELVNGRVLEYFNKTLEELKEWSIRDWVHRDDLPGVVAAWMHSVDTGQPYDIEHRMRRADGVFRWFHVCGLPWRDVEGRTVNWLVLQTDVHDRKLAAEALARSEERFALAVAAQTDGIVDFDVVNDVCFVSERAQRLYGLEPGETLRSRQDWEAAVQVHPDDAAARRAALEPFLSGEVPIYDMEYRVLHQDGIYRWVRARCLLIRDASGRATRLAGAVSDTDARRRIEEELRARQEMLDLAQKSARVIAFEWCLDNATGQNRWSPELEAMYGLAPGSYDGSFASWKKLVHPEDWPLVQQAIKHAQRTGDVAAEYRVVHPNGSTHWLQASGRMFLDCNGKRSRVVGFMQDITERKAAEEEVLGLERRLRKAQQLESMGTLAGGIAHDFNNILGAVLGYGEMALRDAPIGSQLRRDLDAIITAGERGCALVERILAFSRSGASERIAVHVEAVMREVMKLLAGKLPQNVRVEADLSAGRAATLCDPIQVHQVLMNLALNAAQAMAGGGTLRVSLHVETLEAARPATVGTVPSGELLVLKVGDSGHGIPPDILEHVFDPFFTTKDIGVGTGLGLSLVHGIVADIGGAIDVVSTPGEGSVFTVYLPRAGDAPVDIMAELPELPRGSGQRVLVVDDEGALALLVTATLEQLGYKPVTFTSSTAALEACRADPHAFDAVITDERMPGMTGSALISELRRQGNSTPVVLVSGYLGASVVSRAYDAGADEVLKKPLSARSLATTLARILSSR